MEKSATKTKKKSEAIIEFKKRILTWDNPVEFVNNMYGSHPDDDNQDYFKKVFEYEPK